VCDDLGVASRVLGERDHLAGERGRVADQLVSTPITGEHDHAIADLVDPHHVGAPQLRVADRLRHLSFIQSHNPP